MATEATVLVASVEKKHGEKNGKPWTRYALKDGNESIYSTFERDVGETALSYEGRQVVIEFKENGKFKDLLSVKPTEAEPNGDTPPLGTGEYVKAQTAPSDKQSIHRSVALKAAVDTMSHTVATSATPKAAYMKVVPLADAYVKWLEGSPAVAVETLPAGDEDIPFS